MISRPALIERLEAVPPGGVISVIAPAGYGKSSLMAEWRQRLVDQGEVCAWLSMDASDDTEIILSHLAYILYLNEVDCDDSRLLEPGELSSANLTRELRTLLSIIERQDRVFYLIIDDCERCGEEIVFDVLAPILRWAPDNLILAFASRRDLTLDFSTFLVSGMFTSIGAQDLLFHTVEIEAVCSENSPGASVEEIEAASRGWPALVQLIRAGNLSVDVTGDDVKIETGFDLFSSYLDKALLESLPGQAVEFLLQASIFSDIPVEFFSERFSESFIREFVDGTHGFAQFLTLLDNDYQILRMHPLLREFFRNRYSKESPRAVEKLHADAALWLVGVGEENSAIRHACEANNPELIEEILFQLGGPTRLLFQGIRHLYRINELLSAPDILSKTKSKESFLPLMQLTDIIAKIKQGNTGAAQEKLLHVERAISTNKSSDDIRMGIIEYSTVLARVMLDYFSHIPIREEYISTMLTYNETQIASSPYHRGTTRNSEIIRAIEEYNFKRAVLSGEKALKELRAAPSAFGESYVSLLLTTAHIMQGNYQHATRFVQIAEHGISDTFKGDPELDLALMTLSGVLQFRTSFLDINKCREFAEKILEALNEVNTWFDYLAIALRQAVDGYVICDKVSEAEQFLEAAQVIANKRVQSRVSGFLDTLMTLVMIRSENMPTRLSEGSYERTWRDDVLLAEAIYLYGKPLCGRGVDFSEEKLNASKNAGDVVSTERLLFSKAKFLLSNSHVEGSALAANAACKLALASDCLATAYLSSQMLNEIVNNELILQRRERSEDSSLENLFQVHSELSKMAHTSFDDGLLTETEQRVAQELAGGVTDKEIARNLSVSHNTIRFHLKNIYKKLGVSNRTQAVQKLN